MIFGYNTNGFAHHRLDDALRILAQLGYQSVALTLDHGCLNPYLPDLSEQIRHVRDLLQKCRLACVIETGARFLLDPWHKHQPTLLSPDQAGRERRLDFLKRAVDIAQGLGSEVVSFWSGTPIDNPGDGELFQRLADGCRALCIYAADRGVRMAFEPEPGMFINTMARFEQLFAEIQHPSFGLTLDVGHLHCNGEMPIGGHIQQWRSVLWNVHIEDMKRGVHDHLMFGEGEMNFDEVLAALAQTDYAGGVHVELSRHSHHAVETARRALAFLKAHAPSTSAASPSLPAGQG